MLKVTRALYAARSQNQNTHSFQNYIQIPKRGNARAKACAVGWARTIEKPDVAVRFFVRMVYGNRTFYACLKKLYNTNYRAL